MKNFFNGFVNSYNKMMVTFKPSYSVVFTMYHVIPGIPVKRKSQLHKFGKGSIKEATEFYNKVVHKTMETRLAPAEIHLVRGRKKVVDRRQFGPVNELKQFKISA
jgi:hypothetical protein